MRRVFEFKKYWSQIKSVEYPSKKNNVLVWKVKVNRHDHKWGVWLWDKEKITDYKKGPSPDTKFDTLKQAREYVWETYEKEKYEKHKAARAPDPQLEFDENILCPVVDAQNVQKDDTYDIAPNSPDSSEVVEHSICHMIAPDDVRTSEI